MNEIEFNESFYSNSSEKFEFLSASSLTLHAKSMPTTIKTTTTATTGFLNPRVPNFSKKHKNLLVNSASGK